MSEEKNKNDQNAEIEKSNLAAITSQEPVEKTETEINSLNSTETEIENMEVHHPHHVTHKKKWGEYLLEFFMLFLAVFLGFLAENYREHQVERVKEKEYMYSLVKDMEADTAIVNATISYNERQYKADSILLHLLQQPNEDSATLHNIFDLYPATTNFDTEINDPKTFEQLKSTGDMRLVKNNAVLDSMAKYYQYIALTQTFRDEIQAQLQLTYNLSFKIFDRYSFDNNSNTSALLINSDDLLNREYTNKLYNLFSSLKTFQLFLETIKSKAVNLDQLIRKEYHLENE